MTKTRHKATIDAFKPLSEQDSEVPEMAKEEAVRPRVEMQRSYNDLVGPEADAMFESLRHELTSPMRRSDFAEANKTVAVLPLVDAAIRLTHAESRANKLGDECGSLRTENDALLRENAVLRRQVERLERKM